MTGTRVNRRILLRARPDGHLAASDFASDVVPVAAPAPGEALVRNVLLSIDPAARAWMNGPTYREQVHPGEVMAGYTLSEVVEDNGTGTPVGTVVFGEGGWQEYAALPGEALHPVTVRSTMENQLSVLGVTGLTAYFGLMRIGRPQPGQTVVVSAAAGATGSIAGQLAQTMGCRVVGVVGSDEKAALLLDTLGFDAVVNHRSPTLRADVREACPDGVDVYFDNVGGAVLATVLPLLNIHGVVVCCGVVSGYDDPDAGAPGPRGVPGLLVTRRLRMEGFLVHDYEAEWDEVERHLAGELAAGRIRAFHEVLDGLDRAPEALVGLLAGANIGKRLVRIGPDPLTR